ncbi:MAG: short-chain dehydrogenase/reductase [Leifsonia xyli]|nr:MAG: short-chain dehydrogenase/reductase [Leifsonia xyli]
MARTWLITGAGRGFGSEIARAALEHGDQVIATARNPEHIEEGLVAYREQLLVQPLDVTNEDAAAAAVRAGVERFGSIDVLVNNAGYGQAGAFEELQAELIERQFQTNVFGAFNVTRAVLPTMRAQRSGRILNISSLLGVIGSGWWSVYCATKFAISGWSEALSQELAPFGIRVTAVHPGQFSTDFLDPSSLALTEQRIDDYRQLDDDRRDFVADRNHEQPGDPRRFAAAVVELVSLEQPPDRWAAGSDALGSFEARAAQLRESAAEWHALSVSTDRIV